MGNSFTIQTTDRCFGTDACEGSPVTYRIKYTFDKVMPYSQLMLIVKTSPIHDFFKDCSRYNGNSYITFQACDKCIKSELAEYFINEPKGYYRYKWS